MKTRPPAARSPHKKKGYHHQDLRRALLDGAIAFLREGDVTGLTIQVLARSAGVSPGAPYHHFPDKVSLLAALATEGFEQWNARATTVLAAGGSVAQRLAGLGHAWLAFAAEHPSHYQVMFLRDVEDRARFVTLHETSGRGLVRLVELLGEGLPGAQPSLLLARAVAAWSTLHGFASLRAAGVLANIPALPSLSALEREAVAQVVAAALSSAPAPPPPAAPPPRSRRPPRRPGPPPRPGPGASS
jgi:AcrR family transcriptional regulator